MMSSVSEFDSTFHFLLSAFSLMSFVFGLTASVNCVDSSSLSIKISVDYHCDVFKTGLNNDALDI